MHITKKIKDANNNYLNSFNCLNLILLKETKKIITINFLNLKIKVSVLVFRPKAKENNKKISSFL